MRELQAYGVTRIFSPEDGQRMGLAGMIGEMVMRCDQDLTPFAPTKLDAIQGHTELSWRALAQLITALGQRRAEHDECFRALAHTLRAQAATKKIPVLGITGTGGAGGCGGHRAACGRAAVRDGARVWRGQSAGKN